MFKLLILAMAALVLAVPALGKPQVLVDPYPYYSAPAYYSAATYSAPLAYSYPYAYSYSYPLVYY